MAEARRADEGVGFLERTRRAPSPPARGLRERCKLPQWGPGRSPGRNRFWYISKLVEGIKTVFTTKRDTVGSTSRAYTMHHLFNKALPDFKVKIGLSVGYANYSFYRTLIPLFVTTKDMDISWISSGHF